VAIKKINSKRAPLLSQKDLMKKLLDLPPHHLVNKYFAVVREKAQCYLVSNLNTHLS